MELNQKHNFAQQLVIVLLLISLFKGLLFALITPMWQVPDEPTHTAYVETIVTKHRFPTLKEEVSPNIYRSLEQTNFWPELAKAIGWGEPRLLLISAASHPPLYYLLSAPIFYLLTSFGLKWQLFFVRLLGVLASTLIVWLGFKTADLLFPKSSFIKILVPSLIAFQPQFSFVMAGVNNDVLANLLFAATFYALLVIIVRGLTWQRAVAGGLLVGLGIATKASFIIMIPISILSFVISAFLTRHFKEFLKFLAAWAGTVFISTSWLLLWDYRAYRTLFTSATRSSATLKGWEGFLSLPNLKTYFIGKIAHQFWGDFGWLAVELSENIYHILYIFVGLCMLGLLIWSYNSYRKKVLDLPVVSSLVFMLVSIGLFVLAVMRFEVLTMGGSQGRYLFPAIIPIFLLLSLGLSALFPLRVHRFVVPSIILAFFGLNMISVFGYILPHYFGV